MAVTDPSFRCSHASEAAGEPLLGTASTITNWLLVEHPGPWGERALHGARLPDGLGATLLGRERELRIRVLLIRRHGRAAGGAPACFAIHTGPDRPWMERADLNDARDVAALDLDALGSGRSVGLTPVDTALFAVCTHGRRDPCCAERGRPLASALSQAYPDQTWESTHIGGDRFAGNMIAFPHGFYLGAGRARLGCRHRRGIPRRPDRPGAPPRPQLSSHRRAGGGAPPPIGARPHPASTTSPSTTWSGRTRTPSRRSARHSVGTGSRSAGRSVPSSNSRVAAIPRNAPHASSCSRMSRRRRDGRRRHAGPVCVSLKRPYRRGSSMPGRCQ